MGREVRAKQPAQSKESAPIHLPEAEYFKLRTLSQQVDLARIQAQQVVASAIAAQSACFEALGREHGFDTSKDANYRFDDAACTLTRIVAGEPQ